MTDLTEKWKAGELEDGFYYIGNGEITTIAMLKNKDRSFYTWDSCIAKTLSDASEVLAPVPSFKEWQDGIFNFNILKMSLNGFEKRERQLKGLLKECQTIISNNLYEFDSDDCSRSCDLIKEIEEALR